MKIHDNNPFTKIFLFLILSVLFVALNFFNALNAAENLSYQEKDLKKISSNYVKSPKNIKKPKLIFSKIQLDNYYIYAICDQVLLDSLQSKCYSYTYKAPVFNFFKIQYSHIREGIKKRYFFHYDKRIPSLYKNYINDYTKGKDKYDKGHLAPDASFDFDKEVLKSTYLSSNVVPQVPYINRYIISKIEKDERNIVKRSKKDLYVLTGAVYTHYDYRYVDENIFKTKVPSAMVFLFIQDEKVIKGYLVPNTFNFSFKYKQASKKDRKKIFENLRIKINKKDEIKRLLLKLNIKKITFKKNKKRILNGYKGYKY